jgi:hypothetical protein
MKVVVRKERGQWSKAEELSMDAIVHTLIMAVYFFARRYKLQTKWHCN